MVLRAHGTELAYAATSACSVWYDSSSGELLRAILSPYALSYLPTRSPISLRAGLVLSVWRCSTELAYGATLARLDSLRNVINALTRAIIPVANAFGGQLPYPRTRLLCGARYCHSVWY
eukprot:2908481-Rhodomonas_salina.1